MDSNATKGVLVKEGLEATKAKVRRLAVGRPLPGPRRPLPGKRQLRPRLLRPCLMRPTEL